MNESIRQVLLIVQLFFSDQPNQVRQHIQFDTLDNCLAGAKRVQGIREYEGRKVSAIGAGCYIEYGEPA